MTGSRKKTLPYLVPNAIGQRKIKFSFLSSSPIRNISFRHLVEHETALRCGETDVIFKGYAAHVAEEN